MHRVSSINWMYSKSYSQHKIKGKKLLWIISLISKEGVRAYIDRVNRLTIYFKKIPPRDGVYFRGWGC